MSPELGGALEGPRLGQDRLATSIAGLFTPAKPNEDAFFLNALQGVGAVIDGVGGRTAGDLAARTARDEVKRASYRLLRDGVKWPRFAIECARTELIRAKAANRNNMGATAVVAAVVGNHVSIAWTGDARAYAVSTDGDLVLLTKDHGMIDSCFHNGRITSEQYHSLGTLLEEVATADEAKERGRDIAGLHQLLVQDPSLIDQWLFNKNINDTLAYYLKALLPDAGDPDVAREIRGEIAWIAFKNRNVVSSELGEPHGRIGEVVIPTAGLRAILLVSDGPPDNLAFSEMAQVVRDNRHALSDMSSALVAAARYRADSKVGRAKEDDMTAVVLPIRQR